MTDASPSTSNPDPLANGKPFSDLTAFGLNPVLLDTLNFKMNRTIMTPVQAQTLPTTLTGKDVLAQAKTGTGKTLAFLLPAIQKIVNGRNLQWRKSNYPQKPSLLVISPTRELATQIATEAEALLQQYNGAKVHVAVGGTNAKTGMARLVQGCEVIVATPGRLLDYLTHEDGLALDMLQSVQTLVLDEADRLMDMGFLPDIQKIIRCLPERSTKPRQGMLFSATLNPRVHQFANLVLADGYQFINTIPKGEPLTHQHVPQQLITVPGFSDLTAALIGLLRKEIAGADRESFKAIVFGPTSAQVDFYADVLKQFQESDGGDLPNIAALHSRMSQPKRTRESDSFRASKSGILVATDIVARGLDFPGVTHIIQVGLPSDKESYTHRLGRTARNGAAGRGAFIIAQHEASYPVKVLSDIKFEKTPADLSAHEDVIQAAKKIDPADRARAYRAFLGFYKSQLKTLGFSPTRLVQEANLLSSTGMALPDVPAIERKTIGKMGLKGVPGLNIG